MWLRLQVKILMRLRLLPYSIPVADQLFENKQKFKLTLSCVGAGLSSDFFMIEIVINVIGKKETVTVFEIYYYPLIMNIKFGAVAVGAESASRNGSGFTLTMRLRLRKTENNALLLIFWLRCP
jgi:hypothetical protein